MISLQGYVRRITTDGAPIGKVAITLAMPMAEANGSDLTINVPIEEASNWLPGRMATVMIYTLSPSIFKSSEGNYNVLRETVDAMQAALDKMRKLGEDDPEVWQYATALVGMAIHKVGLEEREKCAALCEHLYNEAYSYVDGQRVLNREEPRGPDFAAAIRSLSKS